MIAKHIKELYEKYYITLYYVAHNGTMRWNVVKPKIISFTNYK